MALKIRGSSQIQSNSIEFEQIQKISAGTIMGLAEGGVSAAPAELQAEDVRKIANLWVDDSPILNGLDLEKIDDGNGGMTGGNLDVEGTGNIDGDFTILKDAANDSLTKFKITAADGNLSTLGTMTSQGDIKLTDASDVDQHHLKASDGSLTSAGLIRSKSSIEINDGNGSFKDASSKFSVDSSGNLISAGEGDFDKSVYVGDSITLFGTVDADNGKISSKLLTVGDALNGQLGGQLRVLSTGNVEIDKNLSVSGTLSVGNISVNGTVTQIDTEHLHVKDSMIMLADGNTVSDQLDIGFVGTYNDGTDQLFAGLVRDADDSGIFKLFDKSQEDFLSNEDNEVDFSNVDLEYGHLHLNKITLMGDGSKFIGDVEGALTGNASTATALAAGIDFSIGTSAGDTGDITAAIVNSNGSTNVELSATINSGAVDFAHLNDASVVSSTETLAAVASDSDVMVPTAAAVIDYVESKVSSGGYTQVDDMDLQMGHNGSFVRVEEKTIYHTVSNYSGTYDESSQQHIVLNGALGNLGNSELDAILDEKIMVFVNGQKVRYTDNLAGEVAAGEAEFSIESRTFQAPHPLAGQTMRDVLQFKSTIDGNGLQTEDTLAIGDVIEIKYYVKH